jgi:hypothetical protein
VQTNGIGTPTLLFTDDEGDGGDKVVVVIVDDDGDGVDITHKLPEPQRGHQRDSV